MAATTSCSAASTTARWRARSTCPREKWPPRSARYRPIELRRLFLADIGKLQHRSDLRRLGPAQDPVAEHDVAYGKAAVPEQDAIVGGAAAGLKARDDLADLGVHVLLAQRAGLDQFVQLPAEAALRPVVDDEH